MNRVVEALKCGAGGTASCSPTRSTFIMVFIHNSSCVHTSPLVMMFQIHHSECAVAKLRDLVAVISDVTNISVTTVKEVARRLRESQLIQTGKGGRYGGAEMQVSDAVSLFAGLLALKASGVSLEAMPPITRALLRAKGQGIYNGTRRAARWPRELQLPLLQHLQAGHSFKDALSALVASEISGDLARHAKRVEGQQREPLSVEVHYPEFSARIDFTVPRTRGSGPRAYTSVDVDYLPQNGLGAPALRISAAITLPAISEVAALLNAPGLAEGARTARPSVRAHR